MYCKHYPAFNLNQSQADYTEVESANYHPEQVVLSER